MAKTSAKPKGKGNGKGRTKAGPKKWIALPLSTTSDDRRKRAAEACKKVGWPNEAWLEFGSYDNGLPFSVSTELSFNTDHGNEFGRMLDELREWEERDVAVADAVLELGCNVVVKVTPKCVVAATAMIVSKLHREVIAYYDPAEQRLVVRDLNIKEDFN